MNTWPATVTIAVGYEAGESEQETVKYYINRWRQERRKRGYKEANRRMRDTVRQLRLALERWAMARTIRNN